MIQLSTCCPLLGNITRNENTEWKSLYEHDFLSGVHQKKEWEFVFWCVRTDPNTANTMSTMSRNDIIKSIDWRDIYRRRVETENNWRHGYSISTPIDLEWCTKYGEKRDLGIHHTSATGIVLGMHRYSTQAGKYLHSVECSAYSDLEHLTHKTEEHPSRMSPRSIPLENKSNEHNPLGVHHMNERYIIAVKDYIELNRNKIITIMPYGSEDESTQTSIEVPYGTYIKAIDGQWALLYHEYPKDNDYLEILNMENLVRQPVSIQGGWKFACFYKTDDKSAIVYTTRLKENDETCLEWALHRFTTTSKVKQIRNGWFRLPDAERKNPSYAYTLDESRVVVSFHSWHINTYSYIVMHNNRINLKEKLMPISLFKAGLRYPGSNTIIYCDESFSAEETIDLEDVSIYTHVIGSIYCFGTHCHDEGTIYLMDIDKKEKIRELGKMTDHSNGIVIKSGVPRRPILELEEYGAL
ncbi:hypothetical protein BDF22DRAFT_662531 [Syncephalis plumigaleata]|nr:hypothetical protein BDF22DRAFT_662531 [Syncephalis plumigaleata]